MAVGIWYWQNSNHIAGLERDLEFQTTKSVMLASDVADLVDVNTGLDGEVARLIKERDREIKIVEITAITRTEALDTSREITKDLPDEEPMCGPWGQYFSNVVQYTTPSGENGDTITPGEGVLPSP